MNMISLMGKALNVFEDFIGKEEAKKKGPNKRPNIGNNKNGSVTHTET